MNSVIIMALCAGITTWAVTALGAATVVFLKKPNTKFLNIMLGFASGVMIAASFWSLLEPAIELSEKSGGTPPYIVATLGFLSGALFMWLSDKAVCFTLNKANTTDSSNDTTNRIILLILSITLHNIPEGLAVGVAFGALKNLSVITAQDIMGPAIIAIGIALQNFPEGAAVSIPLRREGYSRIKSFMYGQASAMVEPISAILGAAAVVYIEAILPFTLSFAAGAMILVAVHELIPECQKNSANSYFSTMGIVGGFATMMMLDVMLG